MNILLFFYILYKLLNAEHPFSSLQMICFCWPLNSAARHSRNTHRNSDVYIAHYFHNCNITCTRILTWCHLLRDTYLTHILNNSRNTLISFTHWKMYPILRVNNTKRTCGTAMIFNQSSINRRNKEEVTNYKSNRVTGTKITLKYISKLFIEYSSKMAVEFYISYAKFTQSKEFIVW